MPAVALLSGGLDSMVAAAHAARHGGLTLALTVDYDQHASLREQEAAAAIADHLSVEHRIVAVPFLREIARSALIASDAIPPSATREELDDLKASWDHARAVWVPNRNGLLINIAACFAEALGLERVVVGFNREEARTFPDNRAEFMEAASDALSFTLGNPVRVDSPTVGLDKNEVVKLGVELGVPFRHVWSCYRSGPGHCMACESCQRLKRSLESAGLWEDLAPQLTRGN